MLTHDDDHVSKEQDAAPPAKILPFPPRRSPDWLASPADDLGAVDDPDAPRAPMATPAPVLTRPGVAMPRVELESGIESASASAFAPPPAAAVPPPPEPSATAPAPASPPMDPPRPKRQRVSDPSAPWVPAASSVPVPRLSLVEKPAAQPEAKAAEAGPVAAPVARALPGREEDLRRPAVAPPAPVVLAEAWWVVALDNLRVNRRAQLIVAGGLVAVALLAAWMWPRGVGTTPLSQIRRHPAKFDGREVVVRGRVGDDVFAVGAGWAFYLMQGRDTIVAFSLTRMPEARKVVTLKGQVSTGFLDGRPRQALFEGGAPLP